MSQDPGLLCEGVSYFRMGMAESADCDPRPEIEITPTSYVPDITPFASLQDKIETRVGWDDILREKTGGPTQSLEMTFERLIASLYMSAMLQLGLMAPEGEQPRADILGARQTIDTIGLLSEKTKGNLTPAEQNLLQQSLFDLRMAYLELTNAITKAGQGGTKDAPGAGFGPGPIVGAKK